jgi:hypothetical protein
MDQEGLYVEIWYGGADGSYRREIHKGSRIRITRVDADGQAEMVWIGWDGLDT